jgi:hypothetical protein
MEKVKEKGKNNIRIQMITGLKICASMGHHRKGYHF